MAPGCSKLSERLPVPPKSSAGSSRPGRTNSAPVPVGPSRCLWPDTATASAPVASTSSAISPADWAASTTSGTPASAARIAAIGWTTPFTFDWCATTARHAPAGTRIASGTTRPSGAAGRISTRSPSRAVSAVSGRMTELCSNGETSATPPGFASPWMATLSACVAFSVNAIRDGSAQPISRASAARASYTSREASRTWPYAARPYVPPTSSTYRAIARATAAGLGNDVAP